jgi:serine/threonine protein kinase
LQQFFQHGLGILEALQMKGLTHRDIREENILVRNDVPVLIDFGWAVSDTRPYFTPFGLGGLSTPQDGNFCDVYSLGVVFGQMNAHRYPYFDWVIELMAEPEASLRIKDLNALRILFASAPMVGTERAAGTEAYRQVIAQLLEQISKRNQQLKRSAQDEWLHEIYLMTQDLASVIPLGTSFILVDDDELRDECTTGGWAIPFLEEAGDYGGAPEDDETAIRELERLRALGAGFLVFAWPAFWWLEYYAEFHRYLRSTYRCLLENERVVIFDLRPHDDPL